MVRSYAEEQHVGIDEAIKLAVSQGARGGPTKPRTPEELDRNGALRLKAIRDEVASWPRTGEVADKAFLRRTLGRLMFVDASAWTAIILNEPEAEAFEAKLMASEHRADLGDRRIGRRRGPS
jgi:antitoxin VapB